MEKNKKITIEELVKLDNWKVVVTARQSKKIQKTLFGLGKAWLSGKTYVQYTEEGALSCQEGCLVRVTSAQLPEFKLRSSRKPKLTKEQAMKKWGLVEPMPVETAVGEPKVLNHDHPAHGWAVDTKVRYRDDSERVWKYGFFSHINKVGALMCFLTGVDSRRGVSAVSWKYVELDAKASNPITWVKNTGVAPKAKKVLVRVREEGCYAERLRVSQLDWGIKGDHPGDIIDYIILE